MRTMQDGVPTELLPKQMALDAHGRVLRRPYFLTKEEHERVLQKTSATLVSMVDTERRKKAALSGAMADLIVENEELNHEITQLRIEHGTLVAAKIGGVIKLRQPIICRARFHWLLRWLIKIK